jgi:hypothetical protein
VFHKAYWRFVLLASCVYGGLLAPLAACEDLVSTTCVDGASCVTGENGVVEVRAGREPCGACRTGVLDCSAQKCVDEVLPSEEVCDGVDNDCDCVTDEDLPPVPVVDPRNTCPHSECGPCRDSPMVCVSGTLVCAALPTSETCDGVDNDCDCETDEIPVTFSYSGPPETAGVGVCRPRIEACVDGAISVLPEILPAGEDRCYDGLDNDCDGMADEADNPAEPRSIVLVIDRSASMNNDVSALTSAVCAFATTSLSPLFVAVVAIAADGPGWPHVLVVSGFEPADVACDTLYNDLPYAGSASEYQTDGITAGSAGGLPWPSDDRAVVVLTDEGVQEANVTLQDVQTICQALDYSLYIATQAAFWPMWHDTVAVCGGGFSTLDPDVLLSSLEGWFSPECQ